MKRSLMILLICTFLVASLTACGCSASPQNDAPQNDTTTQNPADTQNDSAIVGEDTTTDPGAAPDPAVPEDPQGSLEQGIDDIRDGVDHAVDDITGNDNDSGGVSYEQMLRNGRVKNGELAHDGTASGMR